jgi:hypothetical protein
LSPLEEYPVTKQVPVSTVHPAEVLELLTSSVTNTEAIADLRNNFRRAFRDYLSEGDRMATLLRTSGDKMSPERGLLLRNQQANLTDALRNYEAARKKYVEAVMGQLAGLSAMSLKLQ